MYLSIQRSYQDNITNYRLYAVCEQTPPPAPRTINVNNRLPEKRQVVLKAKVLQLLECNPIPTYREVSPAKLRGTCFSVNVLKNAVLLSPQTMTGLKAMQQQTNKRSHI